MRENRLQCDFWKLDNEPYALFGHAVDYVTDEFSSFNNVFRSQMMWMHATEHPTATHASAHMYYWAHTNFAAEHRASVVVRFSVLRATQVKNWPWPCDGMCRLDYGNSKEISLVELVRMLTLTKRRGLKVAGLADDARVVTRMSKLSEMKGEIAFSDSVDVGDAYDSPARLAARSLKDSLPVRVTINHTPFQISIADKD